jgi:hypothetical protein
VKNQRGREVAASTESRVDPLIVNAVADRLAQRDGERAHRRASRSSELAVGPARRRGRSARTARQCRPLARSRLRQPPAGNGDGDGDARISALIVAVRLIDLL